MIAKRFSLRKEQVSFGGVGTSTSDFSPTRGTTGLRSRQRAGPTPKDLIYVGPSVLIGVCVPRLPRVAPGAMEFRGFAPDLKPGEKNKKDQYPASNRSETPAFHSPRQRLGTQ